MPRKRFTVEQIINHLREADALLKQGRTVGEVCRMLFDFSGGALGTGLDWDFNIVDFGGGREALRLIVVSEALRLIVLSNVTRPPSEVPRSGIMLIFGLSLAGLGVARCKRAA
jgi:hypothetical protein